MKLMSMTGFGRVEENVGDKTFLVEVKTLNGKQLEVQLKMPQLLKPYEMEMRNILLEQLQRGTIDCFITIKKSGAIKPVVMNTELLKTYYEQAMEVANELNSSSEGILGNLLRLPEIFSPSSEVLTEDEFKSFKKILFKAIEQINTFRLQEGERLGEDLVQRIKMIEDHESKILKLAPKRNEKIREEIKTLLDQNVGIENYDNNRMEQELIYYIEKIDIHEEQIRLRQHCEYFLEVLNNDETGKGKKLSFILQEVGREINTTGSKAYDADIQRLVVQMKDELEKAKEQVLNVL